MKAALDCIAYQITDIVRIMQQASGIEIAEIRVDGGPTKNGYLMQFQSDMLGIPVRIPETEELSGIGAAYAAGLSLGIYNKDIFDRIKRKSYENKLEREQCENLYAGWKAAVQMVISE